MSSSQFRIGITRDMLREDGTTVFDARALRILDEAQLEWEFVSENVKELTAEHAARYDAVCVLRPRVTAATLSGADRRLRIVARTGVGYDTIDVAACTASGVILTNTPDGVRRPVATSVLLLMLALSHKLFVKDRITRAGRWAETTMHMGVGLTGRTIGSLGVGNIGSELFRLLAPLDMTHLAFDPYAKAEDAAKLRVRLTDKDTVMRESDFVCINCPLTPDTRHMVGERELALMKPTAYLINTARGPIIDEQAIFRTLKERRIAGAALDVFEQEPAGADNPLMQLDNIIVTPHSICWTDEFFRGNAESAFRAVLAVSRGQTPTYVVNRDVLTHPEVQARLGARGQAV
jgi:D-3-phosphoglycerate dehydrogenase